MVFVKEGQSCTGRPPIKDPPPLLQQAKDWRICVVLPKEYGGNKGGHNFPLHIDVTGQRPDLVLWSAAKKLVVLVEFTVPAEANVYAAQKRKAEQYRALADACRLAEYAACNLW